MFLQNAEIYNGVLCKTLSKTQRDNNRSQNVQHSSRVLMCLRDVNWLHFNNHILKDVTKAVDTCTRMLNILVRLDCGKNKLKD